MEPGSEERRVEARQPASLLVTYASELLALTGVATDLSPAGLFVETDILDTVGTEAFIRLTDGARGRLEAVGEVVRTVSEPARGTPGMGLRFVELDDRAMHWIRRYCNAFSSSIRVVLVGADQELLEVASGAVEAAGGRPLCLGPEVLSLSAVARLVPHVAVVGRHLGGIDGAAFARTLSAQAELAGTAIHLAYDADGPLDQEGAAEAGVASVLGWRDHRAVARAVDEASRRLGRGPAVPEPRRSWLN
jgi:hypothetical protein